MLYYKPGIFSFRMIIGKYLLHQSKLYQVTQKKKRERKKKSFGIFETSLTIKTIKTTQGRKGTKNFSCFSELFLKTPLLEKKSGNNVNVFSLGTIVRTFNRVINHCSPAFAALGRLSILQTTRQNHKHGKNFSGAAVLTRFSCFS